ncbi:MAG: signal peptide peptidase SppA, partial [Nannocystaceae bacterium]
TSPARPTWSDRPYIAVVLVEGTIIDGQSRHIPLLDLHFAGGDTIVQTLREVRDDPACVGVVLRVNSPGGSALASDVIWREVELTREAFEKAPKHNPPIVVSMADVAASGGYYVSVGTRPIFAEPTTLTGSIGVVSMHFDASGLLQKLGIHEDTLTRGKNADIGGFYRPYTEDQRVRMMTSMTRIYDLFRRRVAAGREMTPERVHELGRGHVYAGADAKALGLVDEFGGLHEAIAWIEANGRVPRTQPIALRVLPEKVTLVDLILSLVGVKRKRRDAESRVRARRDGGAREAPPLALSRAIARLPLSLLFLPQDRASALMPATIELEDR